MVSLHKVTPRRSSSGHVTIRTPKVEVSFERPAEKPRAKAKQGESWRVAFYDKDGNRRFIRLGRMSRRDAEGVCRRVQDLVDASCSGRGPDAELSAWLAKIGDDLAGKLAANGLIPKREREKVSPDATTIGTFVDAYIAGRSDVKGSTKLNYSQVRDFLVRHFGAARDMGAITAGDADDWRVWLKTDAKLGDNTIRRHFGRAKQFFRAAVRKRLIGDNPFGDMRDCVVKSNRVRDFFLPRADAEKVIDACPDDEWRLIFALASRRGQSY